MASTNRSGATARLTDEAERQVLELHAHSLRLQRPEASLRLADALRLALVQVDDPDTRWHPAPRPYPDLAAAGYRWIRQHRYWIGYRVAPDGEGTIRWIMFDTANIAARLRGRP